VAESATTVPNRLRWKISPGPPRDLVGSQIPACLGELGGRPGHRTLRVPAWHGIDPESGMTGGPVPIPVPTVTASP
jgi:hypothetical protein